MTMPTDRCFVCGKLRGLEPADAMGQRDLVRAGMPRLIEAARADGPEALTTLALLVRLAGLLPARRQWHS